MDRPPDEGALEPRSFFDLDDDEAAGLFEPREPVWTALNRLDAWLRDVLQPNVSGLPRQGGLVTDTTALLPGGEAVPGPEVLSWDASKGSLSLAKDGRPLPGAALVCAGAFLADDTVHIGPGALVETGACLRGPLRVGPCAEVRQAAYLRGTVWLGRGCVAGHATEAKGAVFLEGAKAGHFAYVGDSVLGRGANLGAGTKLANLKIIPGTVSVRALGRLIDTGRRKFGAVLGDRTETGCNSVLGPGVLLGPGSRVYPNVTVRPGLHAGRSVHRPPRR